MLMKNFLYLTRVMAKDTEMTMPDTGEKAKAYKTLGSLAMFCIMVPCCLVVGFIVYIMTEALIEAGDRRCRADHTVDVRIWHDLFGDGTV